MLKKLLLFFFNNEEFTKREHFYFEKWFKSKTFFKIRSRNILSVINVFSIIIRNNESSST